MISKTRNISKNLRVIQAVSQLITHFHLFFPQHLVTIFYDFKWYSLLMSLLCHFRKVFLRLYFNIIFHNLLFSIVSIISFLYDWSKKTSKFCLYICILHCSLSTMTYRLSYRWKGPMNQTLGSRASCTNYPPFTFANPLYWQVFLKMEKVKISYWLSSI